MYTHFARMIETNRHINLTRITDPAAAAVRHYADSLALVAWAAGRRATVSSVLDLGTGAGFPAVPIAVVRPDWAVAAIDGTRKKVEFVRRVASEIGVHNLTVEHAHTDHWEPGRRWDLVTARSVAPLSKLLTAAVGFVTSGGFIATFKTAKLERAEEEDAHATVARLGLRADEPFTYELCAGAEPLRRAIFVFACAG